MKKLQLISVFLMFCTMMWAYEKRDILQRTATEEQIRSYLVTDRQWVPYPDYSDRAGWNRLLGDTRETLIREGEKQLGYNWVVVKATDYMEYEKSGSRVIMQQPNDRNTTAFSKMVIAELAEGKGRFLPDIINGVLYFSEMTSWAESAHLASYQKTRRAFPDYREDILELHQGGKAQLLAWTYYFLRNEFDKFDPAISIRLRHELQRRELDPYMQRNDFWWMAFNVKPTDMVNNWNPWCNANALLCFMLLEDNADTLAKAVRRSMVSVDSFLNYVHEDGACEEGPSYWTHAAGKLYEYLDALRLITGGKIDLFKHPMVRNMGEYIAYAYIGDGWVVNFADASARFDTDPLFIYRCGVLAGSNVMKVMSAEILKEKKPQVGGSWLDFFRKMENVRVLPAAKAEQAVFYAPEFVWYPETEFCFMRHGDTFFGAKGGYNNESHNHNDVGTFVLYFGNKPFLIDAGVGTYTRRTFSSERYSIWTMQSNYHNLPVINGVPQSFGRAFRSADVKADTRRRTFSLDIAGAYPEKAGVKTWNRMYKPAKGRLTITDRFELKEALQPNIVNFLTHGTVDVSKPGTVTIGVDGKQAELRYDARNFTATVEPVKLTDTRLSKVWGAQVNRISLTAKDKPLKATYRFDIVRK